jgi:hypothetical protein
MPNKQRGGIWIMLKIIAGIAMLAASASATSAPLAFAKAAVVSVGTGPVGIVVADFNRDGKLDVAVGNGSNAAVSIALATSDETFDPAVRYSTNNVNLDANPESLVAADFNMDGIPDLAVPNEYGGPVFYLSVLLGNSDGSFQTQTLFSSGICPVAIAAADFNGDGKTDLVTANFDGKSVSILLGNGDGTFSPGVDYPVGSDAHSIATGDFNNDGKLDVLVAVKGSNTVLLLLGNGDGTFSTGNSLTTGPSPKSIAVADLNGNGKLDAVVANSGYNTVSVFLGHGDGAFASAVNYPVGALGAAYPNAIALADMDGDGRLDIIAANGGTLSILRGLGNGTFSPPINIDSINDATSVAVADFNGDGRPDLVVTNSSTGTFTLLTNDVLFSSGFEAR